MKDIDKNFKIKEYWDKFYSNEKVTNQPSHFAKYCFDNHIVPSWFPDGMTKQPDTHMLELGCGNGRDSNFFAQSNIKVTAVDLSKEITNIEKHTPDNPNFINSNAVDVIKNIEKINYVYMRWFLHAIKEEEEENILKESYNKLNENGLMFIEVRSIHDHLFGKGIKISDNEYIDTHYRRFHEKDELLLKLKNIGFDIIYDIESNGFSKLDNDDPVLIRVIARK